MTRRRVDFTTPFGRRVARRLRQAEVVWLTTVDARNCPQPRPVWFDWDGATVLILSQPDTGKLRHITRNPNVSLAFDTDEQGDDVMVLLGRATILKRLPAATRMRRYLRKYRQGIKRLDATPVEFLAEYSVPVLVRLTALRGF